MNTASAISSRDNVLARAQDDYNSALVVIDASMIGQISWPRQTSPMVIHLKGAVQGNPEGAVAFLLLMTSLNYRFWRLRSGQFQRYSYCGRTGARALWAAFEAAWDSDEASTLKFRTRLADGGIRGIFGDIPDASSRKQILAELLNGDLEDVCSAMVHKIDSARAVTVADALVLTSAFPTAFGEPYLKKAQLALSMYGAFLRDTGIDIDASDLTAFADYQVPRVLRALGILRYSDSLTKKVDEGVLIPRDSAEERSIRAASILACEEIAEHCNASAADIDNMLWNSQDVASDTRFHLTETTWY